MAVTTQTEPASGTRWMHRNGSVYSVLFITNGYDRPDYPRTVVYVGPNGKLWSRPAWDWHRSMTLIQEEDDGR